MYILHRGVSNMYYKKHCITHTLKTSLNQEKQAKRKNKDITTKTIVYYTIHYINKGLARNIYRNNVKNLGA